MKETYPKHKKKTLQDEGPWVSLYSKACNGQENCLCVDCAWDRALEAIKDKQEKKDV